jgi:hypothetical protein
MKINNKESTEYTKEELDFIYKVALKNNFKGNFLDFKYEFHHCSEAFLELCGVKINYYKEN